GVSVDTIALGKLTVAGVIRPGMDFFSRPELRVFVTGAAWNNGAKTAQNPANPIGGFASAGDNAGLTAGVQAETWW
ncbi:MAG: carbohydrate porin, partial [Solirubrobacteraceae bacterium]